MSKNFQAIIRSFFSIAFIVIVVGSYVIVAQDALTGTWKANDSDWSSKRKNKDDDNDYIEKSKDKVHLNFRFERSNGRYEQFRFGF